MEEKKKKKALNRWRERIINQKKKKVNSITLLVELHNL
jgi:hypothetical protein